MAEVAAAIAEVNAFLGKHDCTTLPPIKELLTFPSDISLPVAFAALAERKVTSAPVYDVASTEFLGFLDTRDLLAWACFAADEKNTKPSLDEIVACGIKARPVAIAGITPSYLARRHPFHSVNYDSTLSEVAKLLSFPDVHRVPVLGHDGKVYSMVSQSAIVKFLSESKERFSLMQMPVCGLGLGSSPVLTVPSTATAAETFKLMNQKARSGLGIVDEDGKLIANTSASDMKVFLENPTCLNLNIIAFIRALHRHDVDIPAPIVAVRPTSTLGHVISRMASGRLHRVFVTDDSGLPHSVISVTDIMRLLTKNLPSQ